jgi:succinate dehydrogenase hydrophobic anchor subunit
MGIIEIISNPYISFILGILSVILAIYGIWITIQLHKKNKEHDEFIENQTQTSLKNIEVSIEQYQNQEKLTDYSDIKKERNFLKVINILMILFFIASAGFLIGRYLTTREANPEPDYTDEFEEEE